MVAATRDNVIRLFLDDYDDEDWSSWEKAYAKAKREWSGDGTWDDLPRMEKLRFVQQAFRELHPAAGG